MITSAREATRDASHAVTRAPRASKLSVLLAGLVSAALLPPLVAGAIAVWTVGESRQDAAEARLRGTARALTVALDREFGGVAGALSAFATSPALGDDPLRPRDLPALHAQSVRIARAYGATVAVVAPDGEQVLSSLRPLGMPLARAASSAAIERALASGRAEVGDLVIGALSGRPVVTVALPLTDGAGRIAGVTVAAIGAERIRDVLAAQGFSDGTYASVADARGVIVARSDVLHGEAVGQHITEASRTAIASGPDGMYRAVGRDGVESVFAYRQLDAAQGWTLVVAEPAARFDAAWRGPLVALGVGGAFAVLLGGLAAALAARRILLPVRHLSSHARALAAGEARATVAAIPPAGIAELEALRQGFAEAEAAQRRLNEGLEARVREALAAREEALARLAQAQRMEALGQLAGGVAHDFNNVIQAVQGGARLIEGRPDDVPRVRRLAAMIAEAGGRGAAVTRRLLAFSRRADLRAEPLDAADLLAGMREILVHTLGTGIEVRVQVQPRLPPLLADKGQLETVLVNLATNARDAMGGNGAITLSAMAEAGADGVAETLDPAILRAGTYVRLSVSDTGAGMDAATLARASEPFFTTKGLRQGTGLGLAMARGFAEQSGGALHIESAPGRGTTVRLWFPVTAEAPADVAPEAEVHPARDGRARLLLVDDEALVREITAEGLEAAGYAVLTVGSGVEALELLEGDVVVDLLISDLSMPGMDGLRTIQAVQRRRPGLPAILLTGFATDAAELALGGAISGSFSLLRKPIEGRALAERIAVMFEGVRRNA